MDGSSGPQKIGQDGGASNYVGRVHKTIGVKVAPKAEISDLYKKYIPLIVNNLSLIMGKETACISVKATTTDGLGFAGTGEGWSVFAIATLNQKL